MTLLLRTLIEKTGHDNGFEHVLSQQTDGVILASARHKTQALISTHSDGNFNVAFQSMLASLLPELQRSFAFLITHNNITFHVASLSDLALLLRRAASLSQALPNQAESDYQTAVEQALTQLPPESRGTEVERQVRQRIGQNRYRDAMLAYWGNACAVTGMTIPEALRASHAKPWAECESDAERLDVFNGFLLTANMDALFDRFLISFDNTGHLITSTYLTQDNLLKLGILPKMSLRWLTDKHQHYLQWHRDHFLLNTH